MDDFGYIIIGMVIGFFVLVGIVESILNMRQKRHDKRRQEFIRRSVRNYHRNLEGNYDHKHRRMQGWE